MLRLTAPFQSLLARTQRAREAIARGRRRLLESLGVNLEHFAEHSLEVRSTGGTAAGIAWRPLDPDTLKQKSRAGQGSRIGISSGALFESAESEVGANIVAIQFRAAHAPHFSRVRPLLPQAMPPEWQDALDRDVEEWAEDTSTATLEGR